MQLKVLLPSRILVDEAVTKVTAEGEDGCFCLLPRHVDFTTALAPASWPSRRVAARSSSPSMRACA